MKDTHTRASVAQLFRALPCQGRGRELESLRSHHFYAPKKFNRVRTLGPSVRELESLRSHHFYAPKKFNRVRTLGPSVRELESLRSHHFLYSKFQLLCYNAYIKLKKQKMNIKTSVFAKPFGANKCLG